MDYVSNSVGVSDRIKEEAGIALPSGTLSHNTRLLQSSHHALTDAIFSQDSAALIPAYFRYEDGALKQIEAIKLQGDYQQLQRPEGTVTLIPVDDTGLQLALVQPEASQYGYVLSVLPVMLREASTIEPVTATVHVPMIGTRSGSSDFQTLLKANGISHIFDAELADLSHLDSGGQYVSRFKQDHQFTLAPTGLTLDSSGVVVTTVNPANLFFGVDVSQPTNTFSAGVTLTTTLTPPCIEPEDFYTFSPMLLALVDTVTGAIAFVVEVDRVNGTAVPTSSCVATAFFEPAATTVVQ